MEDQRVWEVGREGFQEMVGLEEWLSAKSRGGEGVMAGRGQCNLDERIGKSGKLCGPWDR